MKPLPNTVLNIHDAVVLCMVRDPASYLGAMSEKPYEVYPLPRKRRKKYRLDWMFEKVEIDGHHGVAYVSDSLVDFWYDCIEGHLSGYLRPCGLDTFADKVFVVKFEDLVERPVKVLHDLERLGLRRKTGVSEFLAIEESLSHS